MVRVHVVVKSVVGPRAGLAMKNTLNTRYPMSNTFKATKLRDPGLEIDLANRRLTDEGLFTFIADLKELLLFKNEQYPQGIAKLQELHLQGNELTVRSLRELGLVIRMSARDLKELDLSNNKIFIKDYKSKLEVQEWELFLRSFSQCCVLKKVDFGDNSLGDTGIDIFARVYTQSELDYFVNTSSSDEEDREEAPMSSANVPGPSDSRGTSHRRRSSQAKVPKSYPEAGINHYACTRGLQSVPYIILANVDMNNASIVHLSEIIKIRRTPEQLLKYLPRGKAPSLPENPNHATKGIYWQPNSELSPLSLRLMETVAAVYAKNTLHEDFGGMNLGDDDDEDDQLSHGQVERRQKRKKLVSELRRLESQQRIQALLTGGISDSALWKRSLELLTVSRAILLDGKRRPLSAEEELSTAKEKNNVRPVMANNEIAPPAPLTTTKYGYEPTFRSRATTPGVLISSMRFDPESSTFDFMFPSMHAPSPNPVQIPTMPDIGAVLPTYEPDNSSTRLSRQKGKQSTSATLHPTYKTLADKQYRFEYRFGLPLHIWGRIIMMSRNWNRFVPPAHQQRIFNYAADWDGLASELAVDGAPQNQQIWRILDNMKCFSYVSEE